MVRRFVTLRRGLEFARKPSILGSTKITQYIRGFAWHSENSLKNHKLLAVVKEAGF